MEHILLTLAIIGSVIWLLVGSIEFAERSIAKDCKRHSSFYIGDQRYKCELIEEEPND